MLNTIKLSSLIALFLTSCTCTVLSQHANASQPQIGAVLVDMEDVRYPVTSVVVDRFQGQEAPVVIYSLTSSSIEDSPRGMEFLFSPNRLNVAVSRARCISILIGSPKSSHQRVQRPSS